VTWTAAWQPRDAAGAARAVFALAVTAAVTTVAALLLCGRATATSWAVTVPLLVAAVGGSRLLARVPAATSWWWIVLPVVMIAVVAVLGFTAPSERMRPELFAFLPTAYAFRQLRRSAALAVIGICAVEAAALALARYPVRTALLYAGYLDATLLVIGVRLATTGHRLFRRLSQAEYRAATDPLTGLAVRRGLELAAERAFEQDAGRGTALVLVDLDRFKDVNDSHGHPVGDSVLVRTAGALERACRSGDVVARLGGDEFAILLTDVAADALPQRTEAVRASIAALSLVGIDGSALQVTASVGSAHSAVVRASSLFGLYQNADLSLYEAKRSGRNRAVVFGT
jgi:diguanylate cyclase (GGDEF)-like protein